MATEKDYKKQLDLIRTIADLDDLSSTSSGYGASLIGIQDAGGYYTGTTVEAALQELGSGGLSIGSPISGGVNQHLLYIDGSGNLKYTEDVTYHYYGTQPDYVNPTLNLHNSFFNQSIWAEYGGYGSQTYIHGGIEQYAWSITSQSDYSGSGEISKALTAWSEGGDYLTGIEIATFPTSDSILSYGINCSVAYQTSGSTYGIYASVGNASSGSNDYAIYGDALDTSAYAGYFNGKVNVTGTTQSGGYKSSDGTDGATTTVAVAKVGGGTRTLSFKNGLYVSYSDS